jgi:hypothetical protein
MTLISGYGIVPPVDQLAAIVLDAVRGNTQAGDDTRDIATG